MDTNDSPVFTVRILPKEGLVYVSSRPLAPLAQFETESPSESLFTPSRAPLRGAAFRAYRLEQQARAAAAAGTSSAAVVDSAAATKDEGVDVVEAAGAAKKSLDSPGWSEITALKDAPFRAIGWLNIGFDGASGSCSGSLVSNYAVVTAAVSAGFRV